MRAAADRPLEAELPAGIPAAVKVCAFAAALGISCRTVRHWVDSGQLPTLPTPGTVRYVATAELAKLEAQGWPVAWEVLL